MNLTSFYWLPLHELLIKYHSKINKEAIEDVKNKFVTNSSFRYKLIMRNNHIVTHYFDTRLLNYMSSVGIELFDFYKQTMVIFDFNMFPMAADIHFLKVLHSLSKEGFNFSKQFMVIFDFDIFLMAADTLF